MRGFGFLENKRFQLGMILLIIAITGIFLQHGSLPGSSLDDRITTGEDCDVSEKFSIGFGDLDYYPENGTASLEIDLTENLNSTYLEKLKLRGFEGNGSEKFPVIRHGKHISRTGLIATSQDRKKAVGELPLKPMNITILGLTENKSNETFSGLDSGDQMQLRYRQQYVAVKDFCHRNHDIALFKLRQDKPEIVWKSWPPYTLNQLKGKYTDEELNKMSEEELERMAYSQ